MWRGLWNVLLPLSVVSLGKSSQSILIHVLTSHDQCGWIIILLEIECLKTQLNGSQFRQVYSITHITINYSQTQRENKHRMPFYHRWVIWEKACLVITHCGWEYSAIPGMVLWRMPLDPIEWKSIQASLVNQSHHNQSLSNTTREQSRNAPVPKKSDLREGMSSHHSLWMTILFNSNEAYAKLI